MSRSLEKAGKFDRNERIQRYYESEEDEFNQRAADEGLFDSEGIFVTYEIDPMDSDEDMDTNERANQFICTIYPSTLCQIRTAAYLLSAIQ